MTGELGHITVVKDFYAGMFLAEKKGCLEAYASGRAIAEKSPGRIYKILSIN